MFTNHRKNRSENYAILVDEEKLKELIEHLKVNFTKIEYIGRTNDNTDLKFENLSELFSYPNHRERKLIKITIDCSGNQIDSNAEISITLGTEYSSQTETIRYYLRYDDRNWGFHFDDDLQKHLRDFKRWFNPLTKLHFTIAIPILVFAVYILFLMLDYYAKYLGYSGYINYVKPTQDDNIGFVAGIAQFLVLFLIGFIFDLTRKKLFPKIFIALGKQKKTHKVIRNWRYVVFTVFGLGILVNALSNWLFR